MPPFVSSAAGPFAFGRTVVDRVVGFLIDTAVLYDVSCCLLLVGAYSMMHSPWLPGSYLVNYCETYGIFLAYIVLLACLCLLVFRRLRLFEDGLVMAGMAFLLILDPTFFNNVFYTFSLHLGLEVNSFCFALGIALYVALARVGGIPWTWRSAAVTALVAAFVYYYPVGLNHNWTEARTAHYFSALWWMPLLAAAICETLPQMVARSNGRAIPEGMKRKFLIASMIIPAYIVLSHLIEANYAYTLEFHIEYLAPVFLAVGLLIYKLTPIPRVVLQPAQPQPLRIQPQDLTAAGTMPQTPSPAEAGTAVPPPPPMYGAVPASPAQPYYVPAPARPDLRTIANVQLFVWVCAVTAAWCSLPNTDSLTMHLRTFDLTPFRYGLGAVALYLMYFWNVYRKRAWMVAATACLFAAVSGASVADVATNFFDLHPAPFYVLALVFAVCASRRSAVCATLAGGCLLIAILSPLPIDKLYKEVFFVQLFAAWLGAVHWYLYARQWMITLAGTFIVSVAAMLCVFGEHPAVAHHWVWGVDYLIATLGVFCAGWFLQNSFLFTLSVLALAGAPVYFAQNHLSAALTGMRRNYGLLMTSMAFVTLPLAYFMSVLKKRRQG